MNRTKSLIGVILTLLLKIRLLFVGIKIKNINARHKSASYATRASANVRDISGNGTNGKKGRELFGRNRANVDISERKPPLGHVYLSRQIKKLLIDLNRVIVKIIEIRMCFPASRIRAI